MDESLEKKAKAALDEESQHDDAKEDEKLETIDDPMEQLRKLCRGTLKLMQPFRARGQDVSELRFDFCGLTGAEMMDALDSVPVFNMFSISNAQAMALFAATAEKCATLVDVGGRQARLYDGKDIRSQLGAVDAVEAIRLAKLFYNASGQAGNNNISRD